jgi:formate dehydrogenase subunit delta
MDAENLLRMANRIGQFFEAMPDRDEALEGAAMHLKRYWDPRMRRELLAHLEAHGPEAHGPSGLHPLMAEAVERHRGLLEPEAARSAEG